MADRIADRLHLPVCEGGTFLHGHDHCGAGLHHIAAVQHIGTVLTRSKIDHRILHTLHTADYRRCTVLKLIENQCVPLGFRGQSTDMIKIGGVRKPGIRIPLRQELGL